MSLGVLFIYLFVCVCVYIRIDFIVQFSAVSEWTQLFASLMKQYVCYREISYVIMPITHGVPQGSILGPLLFILYINDLTRVSEKLFTILFADDTTILIEGTQVNSMITSLNAELAKLTEWLKANKLSINVSKTHYMVFHRSRPKLDKGDILLDSREYYYKASYFYQIYRNTSR